MAATAAIVAMFGFIYSPAAAVSPALCEAVIQTPATSRELTPDQARATDG